MVLKLKADAEVWSSELKVHPLKNDLFLTFKQAKTVDLTIALERY